jgi:hypothetical protein
VSARQAATSAIPAAELAALGAFVRAAREIREQGTFGFAAEALPYAEANDLVAER